MKYLDLPALSHLSQALSYDSPECKVFTRLEAYSCKDVRKERKLRKEMEGVWKSEWEGEGELSISPEQKAGYLHSPFGSLSDKTSRNLHFLLVSTLNVAFPDYDFSSVRPDEFTRERGAGDVLKALSATVMLTNSGTSPRSYGSYPSGFTSPPVQHAALPDMNAGAGAGATGSSPSNSNLSQLTHPTLHRILNDAIALDECVVYSYTPPQEADPHAEDQDLENGMDDEGDLIDDDDNASSGSDMPAGDDDDAMMMMSMDEDDEDITVPGNTPVRKRSKWRRNLGENAEEQTPPRSSEWEGSLGESGQQALGPSRYTSIRARGGLLWSVNYFFYSKRQKRILFMSVWARKKSFGFSPNLSTAATVLPPPMVTQPHSFQGHQHSNLHHPSNINSGNFIPSTEAMPSLAGIAASINSSSHIAQSRDTSSSSGSQGHPIRIAGSPTPTPQTATGTTTAAGTSSSGPISGAIPNLRRQRSTSTASTRSTNEVLGNLSSKTAKRVKV